MRKILVIVGSGIKNGNTDKLADAMAKREKGILMKSILKEHIFWEAPCKEDLLKNAKEKYNLWRAMEDLYEAGKIRAMEKIAQLDKNVPSMLDCSKPSEIDRLYDYLNNPVLTSL